MKNNSVYRRLQIVQIRLDINQYHQVLKLLYNFFTEDNLKLFWINTLF